MNADFIPAFDSHRVFVQPWLESASLYGWIALMGFLVACTCGLIGNYLLLRRMALVGDAISHSVLPGLAIAFLLSNSRGHWPMFVGALGAGVMTTLLIEVIHRRSRVKQDSAIGITFSSLFAIGVILISIYADKIDLDQDCVLHGELAFIPFENMVTWGGVLLGPVSLVRMAAVLMLAIVLIIVFYKELLVSAFDEGLASALGFNPRVMHYGLMALLSVVVVSAFQSVGAILVIAMLILPGATASLVTHRLPRRFAVTVLHAALSSVAGLHLSIWLDCSIAAAMVIMGSVLFFLVWMFNPSDGLVVRLVRRASATDVGCEEKKLVPSVFP